VYKADWKTDAKVHEVKIHTRENLDRQYTESTGLLGAHLRLYQIHSAAHKSGVLQDDAVTSRLGELRDAGMVIGLTASGPDQADTIRRALEIEVDGRRLFGSVQATWNLLETSAGAALASAARDTPGSCTRCETRPNRCRPGSPKSAHSRSSVTGPTFRS
jgi:aryl-alcohol dehydrogenase-like predicted oxidoreductase